MALRVTILVFLVQVVVYAVSTEAENTDPCKGVDCPVIVCEGQLVQSAESCCPVCEDEDVNPQQLGKRSIPNNPECPDGSVIVDCLVAPCDQATCPAYPNAVCANNNCGGCNTVWSIDGVEVDCTVCTLPIVRGNCKAYNPSYGYNSTSGQCEYFIYGGCSGNGNRFETKEDCEQRCVCTLPIVRGRCRAYNPSWGYISASGQCEYFIYGGCSGNGNRFETKEECEQRCG